MADDTRVEPTADVQQPAPIPSANQPVPEPTKTEGVAPQEVTPQVEEGTDLDLPKGVSERTKEQFDKLKKQLSEYKQRLFGERVFETMRPAPITPAETKPLYDPETGLVDVESLNDLQKKATEAEVRASRAEQAVQSYITTTQEREGFSAHPELDPSNAKFDEKLHQTTRALLMDSMAYPESYGNKTLTFKEAGDVAKEIMGRKPETPQEEAQRLTPKEQASLGATGRPGQGIARQTSEEEAERLRWATRRGDVDAQVARMSRIPTVPASRTQK